MADLQQQLTDQFALLTEKMTEEYVKIRDSLAAKTSTGDDGNLNNGGRPPPSPSVGGSSGSRPNQNSSNWRFRKLDMAVFDGVNPDGWILRAERYFNFYRLQEEEKIEAAVVALEGDALLWYQWEHRRRPIRCWEDLKFVILRQFRSLKAGSLYEQWLAVKQTGSVHEYQRQFIEFSAPLSGITEDVAVGQFINGLKNDIKAEVRVMGPRSLDHAMELAVKIEDKVNPSHSRSIYSRNSQLTSHYPIRSSALSFNSNTNPTNVRPSSSTSVFKPIKEVRRLSEKELQEKKSKGLCFKCDDKWQVGHQCKRKELSIMLTLDDDDDEMFEEPEMDCEDELKTEVCLNSVLGIMKPKTLKLKGHIQQAEVVVMVDPGATHNFVSLQTVEKLKLPIVNTGGFGVALGTGVTVQGQGECQGVVLHLQGLEVNEDFLPLTLGNSDVILGVQWLEKIGTGNYELAHSSYAI